MDQLNNNTARFCNRLKSLGVATYRDQLLKLAEELGEAVSASSREERLEELADVVVVALNAACIEGDLPTQLLERVARKVDVNANRRTWQPSNGQVVRHG